MTLSILINHGIFCNINDYLECAHVEKENLAFLFQECIIYYEIKQWMSPRTQVLFVCIMFCLYLLFALWKTTKRYFLCMDV